MDHWTTWTLGREGIWSTHPYGVQYLNTCALDCRAANGNVDNKKGEEMYERERYIITVVAMCMSTFVNVSLLCTIF